MTRTILAAAAAALATAAVLLGTGAAAPPASPAAGDVPRPSVRVLRAWEDGSARVLVRWPASRRHGLTESTLTVAVCAPGGGCTRPDRARVLSMTSSITSSDVAGGARR